MEEKSLQEMLMSHVSEEHWQELGPIEEEWFEILTRKAEEENSKKEKDSDKTEGYQVDDGSTHEAKPETIESQSSSCDKKTRTISKNGSLLYCMSTQFSPFTQRQLNNVIDTTVVSSQEMDSFKTPVGKAESSGFTPGHSTWKKSGVRNLVEKNLSEYDSFLTPPVAHLPAHLRLHSTLTTSTPDSTDYKELKNKKENYHPVGLDIDDSVTSWTSSLVTPGPKHLGDTSFCDNAETTSRDSSKTKSTQGAARMLFSPDGKNTTQEFDIMAGLTELEASQEDDEVLDSPLKQDNEQLLNLQVNDQHLTDKATRNQQKSVPDPGGGGDSEDVLCSEDCFSQRLHDQTADDVNITVLDDCQERLELECNEGREGVVIDDNNEPLELGTDAIENARFSSTPIVPKDASVSEEKFLQTQSSPCIDGILSDLFGTPPSRNCISRKPPPKRSRRSSGIQNVKNSSQDCKTLVSNFSDEFNSNNGRSIYGSDVKGRNADPTSCLDTNDIDKDHAKISEVCNISKSSTKVTSNTSDHLDLQDNEDISIMMKNEESLFLKDDADLGFSQLSPGSVSALLQASDVSNEHFVDSKKVSQKSSAADISECDAEVTLVSSVNSLPSAVSPNLSKCGVALPAVTTQQSFYSGLSETPMVASSGGGNKPRSPALVSVASASKMCHTVISSNASAVAVISTPGITKAVTTPAASMSAISTISLSNSQSKSVPQILHTPQYSGRPASHLAHRSSYVTPQNRVLPGTSGSSKSISTSRRNRKTFMYPTKQDIEDTSAAAVYELETIKVNDNNEDSAAIDVNSVEANVQDTTNADQSSHRPYKPYARRRIHTAGFSTLTNFNASEAGRKNLKAKEIVSSSIPEQVPVCTVPQSIKEEKKVVMNKTVLPKFTLVNVPSPSKRTAINKDDQEESPTVVKGNTPLVRTIMSDDRSEINNSGNAGFPCSVRVDSEVSFKLSKSAETSHDMKSFGTKLKKTPDEGAPHFSQRSMDVLMSNIPDDSFCDIDFDEIDKLSKSTAEDKTAISDAATNNEVEKTLARQKAEETLESGHKLDEFVVAGVDKECPEFKGFSTANGKSISVSNKALNAGRTLMETVDKDDVTDAQHGPVSPPAFIGFTTAKGTSVSVSKKALNAAMKLMETDDGNSESLGGTAEKMAEGSSAAEMSKQERHANNGIMAGSCVNSFPGFSTAKGSSISISSKALSTAQKFMESDEHCSVPDTSIGSCKVPDKPSGFTGFSTAAGKGVCISNKALSAAKKLMESDDDHSVPGTSTGSTQVQEKSSGFTGFSTAAGKDVCVSNKALNVAQKLMESDEDNSVPGISIGPSKVTEKSSGFTGFSTAAGKDVCISNKALNVAQRLMKSDEDNSVPGIRPSKVTEKSSGFTGFLTAAGKGICLSNEALNAAQKLMELDEENSVPDAHIGPSKVPQKSSEFAGFSTAAGKGVCISNKSLNAAKKLMESVQDVEVAAADKVDNPGLSSRFDSCSVSSKMSTVAETKMVTATKRQMVPDDQSSFGTTARDLAKGYAQPSGFIGFSTAKGNKISVTSKALVAARRMMESEDRKDIVKSEFDEDSEPPAKKQKSEEVNKPTVTEVSAAADKGVTGFSTASGNSVRISGKALNAARKLLEADDEFEDAKKSEDGSSNLPSVAGFDAAVKTVKELDNTAISQRSDSGANEDVAETSKQYSKGSEDGTDFAAAAAANPKSFKGFATASGKDVAVSSKALDAARMMLESDDGDGNADDPDLKPVKEAVGFAKLAGFSTASGNKVAISSNALNAARKLMETENDSCATDDEIAIVPGSPATQRNRVAVLSNSSKFPGFSTARGKNVSVSSKALDAARKLMKEDDEAADAESVTKTEATGFTGFSTAKGKPVSISKKALNDARKLLESDDKKKDVSDSVETDHRPPSISGFVGFTTAKGNSVKVSDKALKNAKKFMDSEDNKRMHNPADELVNKPSLSGFAAFTTAKGNSVSVSSKALDQARKLMDADDEQNVTEDMTELEEKPKVCEFAGFTTAKGNCVAVSSKALNAAKKLLESDDDFSVTKNVTMESEKRINKPEFAGFTTAKGSSVSVSANALNAARKLLESDDEQDVTNKGLLSEEKPKFAGFTTAKGNSVGVSEKALNAARKLMDTDSEVNDAKKLSESGREQPEFAGFTTAKGNSVSVSSKALSAAKKLLESDEGKDVSDFAAETVTRTAPESSGFAGFSTAGGKNVSVSGKALSAARSLLETDDVQVTTNVKEAKVPQFAGFTTAKGNSVSVSSKALSAAKKLLESDESKDVSDFAAETVTRNVPESSGFAGFSTAGGKNVSVSGKALNAARKFLETDDVDVTTKEAELHRTGSSGFAGFSTAGGNSVSISTTALNAAKKLLESSDESVADPVARSGNTEVPSVSESVKDRARPPIFAGFSTAKGNAVSVSTKALDAAKELLASAHGEEDSLEEKHFDAQSKSLKNMPNSASIAASTAKLVEKLVPTDVLKKSPTASEVASEKSRRDELEAEESMKAFLEDDDWDLDACQAVMVATTTSQKFESKQPSRPWMKPKYSSPEDMFDRSVSGLPVKSRPEGDTEGASVNIGNTNVCNADRPGFEQKPQLVTRTNNFYKLKMPDSHSVIASSIKQPSKFSTPVKSLQNNPQSRFKTPVKDVKPQGTTFKTPVKKPSAESSFVPPTKQAGSDGTRAQSQVGQGVKRTGSPAENDPPKKIRKFEEAEKDGCDETRGAEDHKEDAGKVESQNKNIPVADEVRKSRAKARLTQAKRIKEKREDAKIKPFPGTLYKLKRGGRKLPLREYVMNTLPQRHTQHQVHLYGVSSSVPTVSITTAEDFRFNMRDFLPSTSVDSGHHVILGDGASVVMDEVSCIGKEEICNGFLDMEGVDPNLICRDWVYNHYKWIIWKSAAMEVCFPHCFGARCLTPDRVMLQLKLRYDREIDNSQRSCLKKIYEQDDTPARPMVLCVCGIQMHTKAADSGTENKEAGLMLQLTDGWYSIPAQPDSALTRLVNSNRICIGDKLNICGAEMLGNPEPSPPLQTTGDTVLKLFCNSTRKARWDSKLGYSFSKTPMIVPLNSLRPDGGMVSCLDVIVTRIYPLQFMEKNPQGGITFRNEKCEARAAQTFDKNRQKHMEILFTKLQKDFEDRIAKIDGSSQRPRRRGKRLTAEDLRSLQTGQEIYEATQTAADPCDLEASLSNHQMSLLCDYRRLLQDQHQAELSAEFQKCLADETSEAPKRNVTSLLKIRLAGLSNSDIDSRSSVMLTIWKPTEDLHQMFAEGKSFKIHNLLVSENRGKGSSAVSLTAARSTRYIEINVSENLSDIVYEPREVITAADMMAPIHPTHNEMDVVGIVVLVTVSSTFDRPSGTEGQVQLVYLADTSNQLYAIKFWGGLKAYGLEETLKVKACLGCANLQWRGESQGKVPTLTASELSTFSSSPKESHLKLSLNKLLAVIQDKEDFVQKMCAKLNEGVKTTVSSTPSRALYSATPSGAMFSSRTSITPGSTSSTSVITPAKGFIAYNTAPYDTPITPAEQGGTSSNDENVDPLTAKKRLIQRQKAQRLAQYGSPPKISSLPSPANPVASKAFKPPTFKTPTPGLSGTKNDTPVISASSSGRAVLNAETPISTANKPRNPGLSSSKCEETLEIAYATPKTTVINPSSRNNANSKSAFNSNVTRARGRKSLGSRRSLSWRKPDSFDGKNTDFTKAELCDSPLLIDQEEVANSDGADSITDQCDASKDIDNVGSHVTVEEDNGKGQELACSSESKENEPSVKTAENLIDSGSQASTGTNESEVPSQDSEPKDAPENSAKSSKRAGSKLSKGRKRRRKS